MALWPRPPSRQRFRRFTPAAAPQVMGAPSDSNGPSSELKAAIDASFGSMDEMKAKFNAVRG